MIEYFHNYLPQPIFLDLRLIKIYYYGLFFVIAFIIGYFLVTYFIRKKKLKQTDFDDLLFYLLIFGLIGARLYHVFFYNFDYFNKHPSEIFAIWQGGLAIQGAIIASLLTIYFYCRKKYLNFWQTTDLLALPLALGQAIGRFGNYFNQEVYGRPTTAPWGIPISQENRLLGYENFSHFQPLFIFESFLNFILFLFLLFLYKKNLAKGRITLFYLMGYSIIRFFLEFLRIEPVVTIFGIRWPQIVCLLIIIISLIVLYNKNKFSKFANNI